MLLCRAQRCGTGHAAAWGTGTGDTVKVCNKSCQAHQGVVVVVVMTKAVSNVIAKTSQTPQKYSGRHTHYTFIRQ